MENSKLLDLLRRFSGRERKDFLAFVQSPYFNRNEEVTRLYTFLIAGTPAQWKNLSRQTLYEALFPGLAYDEAQLNHLMSFLLKLAERFLGQVQYEQNMFMPRLFTLQALAGRDMEKHYRYLFEQTRAGLEGSPHRDTQYHLHSYLLENVEANRLSQSSVRKFNEHIQRTADHLDYFFLAEKLRYTCYMLTSQVVVATPYNLQFVNEVCAFTAAHPMPENAPAIQAYYRIFQLLTKEESHSDFEALKNLLIEFEPKFDREVLAELYHYAINYCNRQTMKTGDQYVEEALDLYIKGIDSGILLDKGQLSPWHFKNIIKLALRLKKYDWTEQFILENTQLLAEEFRTDAFHYNLAELYYYTGRTDKAMLHLNQVEFTDVTYNLGAKIILSKIYFESDATDALESLLHAFKTYLHRHKVISEDIRRAYLNFISVLRQTIRATPEKYPALRETIEQMPLLAAKNWLLRIVE